MDNMECESEPVHSVVWYNVCQSEHVHSVVYYNPFIMWLFKFLTKSERPHYVCQSEHVHFVIYYNRFIMWLFPFLTKSERLHYVYVDVNMESESEPVHSVV
jgi:hypothetical protein